MVNFLLIFFSIVVKQVLFVIAFTAIEPFYGINIKILIPINVLIIYMIIYFVYSKKFCDLRRINKITFDILSFISWIISGCIISFIVMGDNVVSRVLPVCSGLLCGIEYFLIPVFLTLYLIVVFLLKFVISIIAFFKKGNRL